MHIVAQKHEYNMKSSYKFCYPLQILLFSCQNVFRYITFVDNQYSQPLKSSNLYFKERLYESFCKIITTCQSGFKNLRLSMLFIVCLKDSGKTRGYDTDSHIDSIS